MAKPTVEKAVVAPNHYVRTISGCKASPPASHQAPISSSTRSGNNFHLLPAYDFRQQKSSTSGQVQLHEETRRELGAYASSFDQSRQYRRQSATRLRQQVKYAEVEAMDWQTLKTKRTVLEKGHPDTLTNMNNLATALELEKQGKFAEAEAMHRQMLQLTETMLGKFHPDTLISMNNLAESLEKQGKYAESRAIHQRMLQLRETMLGKDHPDTLTCMNNLAVSLRLEGNYAEAEHEQPRSIASPAGEVHGS
ncbi:hypothetical protein V493_00526 [Pseudogymnoascus sp. VKM F-4281 (FW-2241)]|nr:hypothetical protein V493_00526 [Pseudogymnoascus sp. VKM F-4281 (FW-2241)]